MLRLNRVWLVSAVVIRWPIEEAGGAFAADQFSCNGVVIRGDWETRLLRALSVGATSSSRVSRLRVRLTPGLPLA